MFCDLLSLQCLSPVNRLPVELLSYIFILGTHATQEVLESDAERSPPFTSQSIRTPLILSSVNRHWRDIARNTPSLWTSLCITVEMIDILTDDCNNMAQPPTAFNTSHLNTYLKLSRNYPLDILIDARDQDWDFSEPEIPSEYECDTYTPPFSSDHMSTALSLLLPHLRRWRSIDILTDSWAPMYVALQQIHKPITTLGAPLLESLTLMRCNDFVSYSPTFQPHEMIGPALFRPSEQKPSRQDVLPRLTSLTLRGVHVDWSSLTSILSRSQTTLRALELSSHCSEVRPTLSEFRQLLATSPSLRKLVVNGSGPFISDDAEDDQSVSEEASDLISLPCLDEITLGYRSAYDGQIILEQLDAPNVKVLTLEDSNHPGEPEEIDAGSLLAYMGTGDSQGVAQELVVAYTTPDGVRYHIALDKEPSMPMGRKREDPLVDGEADSQATFPLLEVVTLKGVKACSRPLQTFFNSLQNLRHLELSGMTMHAVRALLPADHSFGLAPVIAPCPQLQSLCIRGFESLQLDDLHFVVARLSAERLNNGACGIHEVDIHMDHTSTCITEDIFCVSQTGTKVNIFKDPLHEDDDEEGMYCDDEDIDTDPYKAGGVFNDPLFDAYYAGVALAR
ncbi:hypothetical protein BDZ94DRAFT_1158972 [Collybia nuda]|uniref:F-box domain-containing protein n=1 Tax=Collybia nuda TaxID=64659 RepID=A0A9P6CL42_9AGAR|nr:hypothetical protein BDZ94DRAFT_1158972 [Collybia nuda]